MQLHTKIYFDHYGIGYYPDGSHDFIACEVCKNKAIDVHHIYGRGGDDPNRIENLIALCRKCHEMAHKEELTKGDLHVIHNSKLY